MKFFTSNNPNALILDRNQLEIIYGEGLLNTTNLLLSNRDIEELLNKTFMDLTHVESLNLASNKLNSLNFFTFEGLENLKHLFLQYNQLSHIDSRVFYPLKNLHTLILSNNQICSLEPSSFEGLTLLKDWDFSENSILF